MSQQIINGVGKAGIRSTSSGGSTSIDTDAQAFITAAALTDTTQQNAINDLVLDLKGAGIWTKMKALYPMIGGTASSHKWNLKDPRDLDVAYRLVFNGGWTHSSTGALPNGTTAYADTKLIPSTDLLNLNSHLSYYSGTNSLSGQKSEIGSGSNSPTYFYMQLGSSGFNNNVFKYGAYSFIQSNAGSNSFEVSDSLGFYISSRINNVETFFKRNTKYVNTTATSTVNRPTHSVYIGARNWAGSAAEFTNRQCRFSSIGEGLTDVETQLFYQIVEKFQLALGRNVDTSKTFYYNTSYLNETNAFIFNGSISDGTQISAINTLVNDLKTTGIWSKMKAVYPFVGGTATSHKFNLITPVDGNSTYRLQFYGGWTHSSTGALPNGTDGYANTFLIPNSVSTLNSMSLSYYSRTNSTVGNANEIGCWDGAGYYYTALSVKHPTVGFSVFLQNHSTDVRIANSDSRGFYFGSLLSNRQIISKNGQILNTGTITPSGRPSVPVWIGRSNGNQPYYSNRETAFASIGDGLTDLESNLFYQIVEKFQYALGRNVNTAQPFYYNSSYTNETNAFIFNGAISDATQISAVNTLVTTLKTAGIWTKMKAVYPMVGGTALAHKFNLVNPVDAASAYALTFAGGWTHSSTGALPNGTTGYANTNLVPNTALTTNNHSMAVYSRTNNTTTASDMACQSIQASSTQYGYMTLSAYNTGTSRYQQQTQNTNAITVSEANTLGFYQGSRTSSTSFKGYKNGILKGTNTNIASAIASYLPINSIYLSAFNFNNNGVISTSDYSNRECAFSSIGDGLTDAEATTFYNAVQAFQTTLGRQV